MRKPDRRKVLGGEYINVCTMPLILHGPTVAPAFLDARDWAPRLWICRFAVAAVAAAGFKILHVICRLPIAGDLRRARRRCQR